MKGMSTNEMSFRQLGLHGQSDKNGNDDSSSKVQGNAIPQAELCMLAQLKTVDSLRLNAL